MEYNTLRSILEDKYGYPISSQLQVNIKDEDRYKNIEICSELSGRFVVGIYANPGENIDIENALIKEFGLSGHCDLGFIFDGLNLFGYRYKQKTRKLIKIKDFESYKIAKNNILTGCLYGKSKGSAGLVRLPSNLENIFFQCHSFIRDIDGLHADEALDELCKLIYAKLFDEESTQTDSAYRFQVKLYGNDAELFTAISKLYSEANEYDKRVYSLRIPGYKRSRGVFDEMISISASALLKVVTVLQKFDFSSTSADIKGRAFQNIFLPALRSGMGQYFTPTQIVKFIIQCCQPTHRDLILDPFCGSAHFLSESLDCVRKKEKNDKFVDEFAYHKIHGIEKSERMVRIAMTDMRLHGDGHANIRCTDALLPFDNYHDLKQSSFDYVFTNPPFGSLLGRDSMGSLGEFEFLNNKSSVPLEVLGLERSIQFLKEQGKLSIVLPDSVLVNNSTQNVRLLLSENVDVSAVVSLPVETFSPFGANIKTSILFLIKRRSNAKSKTLCLKIDNVGYDAAGRDISGSELPEAAEIVRRHLVSEGW